MQRTPGQSFKPTLEALEDRLLLDASASVFGQVVGNVVNSGIAAVQAVEHTVTTITHNPAVRFFEDAVLAAGCAAAASALLASPPPANLLAVPLYAGTAFFVKDAIGQATQMGLFNLHLPSFGSLFSGSNSAPSFTDNSGLFFDDNAPRK